MGSISTRSRVQHGGAAASSSKLSGLSSSGWQRRGLRQGLEGAAACQDTAGVLLMVRAALCGSLQAITATRYHGSQATKFPASVSPWHCGGFAGAVWCRRFPTPVPTGLPCFRGIYL